MAVITAASDPQPRREKLRLYRLLENGIGGQLTKRASPARDRRAVGPPQALADSVPNVITSAS